MHLQWTNLSRSNNDVSCSWISHPFPTVFLFTTSFQWVRQQVLPILRNQELLEGTWQVSGLTNTLLAPIAVKTGIEKVTLEDKKYSQQRYSQVHKHNLE